MIRVVTIGINDYKDSPLRGCVNDAQWLAHDLVSLYNVPVRNIRQAHNARGTYAGIAARLEWLRDSTLAGDLAIFHFSGHGTQVASRVRGEVDGLDECLVPYDFDWDDDGTWFIDDDLVTLAGYLNAGARLLVILDSCCSGDMIDQGTDRVIDGIDRAMDGTANCTVERRRPKYLRPPADIAWRAKDPSVPRRSVLSRLATLPNVALLAGCQSSGTCSDAYINNEPQGAFTWALRTAMRADTEHAKTVRELMDDARAYLIEKGFKQQPVESGDANVLDAPLGTPLGQAE